MGTTPHPPPHPDFRRLRRSQGFAPKSALWMAGRRGLAKGSSVELEGRRVLDRADHLDLILRALRTAAAHDLDDVGGDAPIEHRVAGGLHDGVAARLGVAVLARDPRDAGDFDLAGADLLEPGQCGLALLEPLPRGGEGVVRAEALHGDDDVRPEAAFDAGLGDGEDRKSTRLNSSHVKSSYAVFCLKKNILYEDC